MRSPISCQHPGNDYEELYRLLVHEMRDYAVFLVDPNACIASWNEGVGRNLGYAEHEFVGTPFSQIFTPEDQAKQADREEIDRARNEGRSDD